jgi:hypothetical protein
MVGIWYENTVRYLHSGSLMPSPRSHRRRRRRRYPVAAQPTTGAGAAAATGPEQAPPTTGASGGRIWGRGNKNTVAYPVAEQDRQKRVRPSRRSSRRARTGAGLSVAQWAAAFVLLQRLANILKYPFISFHLTEGKTIAYFRSWTQYLVHTDQ